MLTDAELERYREQGWVVSAPLLAPGELAAVTEACAALFPTGADYHRDPAAHAHLQGKVTAGVRFWPTRHLVLDLLPVHPTLVAVAEQLVGEDLQLIRATYWAKYADAARYDQDLHQDFQNQSLVVPDEDEMVSFFLFLSDVTVDDGPTMLLPQPSGTPLRPEVPRYRFGEVPDVYAREVPATGPAGAVLAYRSGLYHRGSRLTAPDGYRLSLTYCYCVPRPWNGHQSFPRLGEHPGTEAFLPAATPRQRALIGFPAVGDPYWTEEHLDLVQRRYPAMDMTPYRRWRELNLS